MGAKIRRVLFWVLLAGGVYFLWNHFKDNPGEVLHKKLEQVDQLAADAKIEADVKMRLSDDKALEGTKIQVRSEAGTVTLRGTVFTMDQIDSARSAAYGAEGVKKVICDFTLK